METKIIRNYSYFCLFEGLAISFFFGTYQLFLVEKGLSLLEINLINASFMLASFLFEIPTGVIADFFGRKISVIVGLFIYAFSFFLYFISNNFWQFLLAEIIGAIAFTCISGALEALVVDSLIANNYTGSLSKVFRRGEIRHLGIIVGAVLGGLAGEVNLAWPWLLSSIFFIFLAIFSIFSLHEEKYSKDKQRKVSFEPLKKIAKESISYGFRNRPLMVMIVFSSILAFVLQSFNMYWPLVLKQNFALETKYMGIIFALVVIFAYSGAQFSNFWKKRFTCSKKSIFLSQMITLIGIIGLLFFLSLSWFLIFFLIHEFGRGLFKPLLRDYINKNIDSKNRSTVLSFESMIVKAGAGLGLVIGGLVANNFNILGAWILSALILFLAILFFCFYNKLNKKARIN
jgi:MFS family permease